MISFKLSAPGKIILFGEHAVVYGKTAIATSLNLRTTIIFKEFAQTEQNIKISFPKVHLAITVSIQSIKDFFMSNNYLHKDNHDTFYGHVQQFVYSLGYGNLQQKLALEAFFYLLIYIYEKEQINITAFELLVSTDLSIGSGLGSSASFAVCLAACFLHWSHLQKNICRSFDARDLEIISKYAFNCENIMHGNPSGIDNSVCTYGSIIEFKKGDCLKLIPGVKSMKVLLVDTRVQRSTKALVEKVNELKRMYPVIIDSIFDTMDYISKEALQVIKNMRDIPNDNNTCIFERYKQLMILINMNQGLLATCQVSHPSLDRICEEAHSYGLAAKLTGAGGGGYAYILLLPDTQPETISSISRKLIANGYSVLLSSLGCSGVKIEE